MGASLTRRPRGRRFLALARISLLALALLIELPLLVSLGLAGLGVSTAARTAVVSTATDLLHRVLALPADSAALHGGSGASGAPGVSGPAGGASAACTSGNRDVVGQNIVVTQDMRVCGHANAYGGNVTVLGRVEGDVHAIAGSVLISGQVTGSVLAVGGNVDLDAGASVGGDVQAFGGTVNRNAAAAVGGTVTQGNDLSQVAPPHTLDALAPRNFPWLQLLFWALAGTALALLFPNHVLRVRAMARAQPAASLVSGILGVIVGAALALVLAVTIICIPLALLVLAALWVAWVIGTVALGSWLGEALLKRLARERPSFALTTVLGVLLLAALEAVPYVGILIGIAAGCLGLGAALRAYAAARRAARAVARTRRAA
jgi:hypothetical protein